MKKIKKWLYERFLPEYCRLSLLEGNRKLEARNKALEQKNRELSSYIEGLESGMKAQRRIIINTAQRRE